jgi:hypothetical protein
MTIINTTLPGHQFHSGQVSIRVIPQGDDSSDIEIVGTGTGSDAWLNDIIGTGFFGLVAHGVQQSCLPGYAPLLP